MCIQTHNTVMHTLTMIYRYFTAYRIYNLPVTTENAYSPHQVAYFILNGLNILTYPFVLK